MFNSRSFYIPYFSTSFNFSLPLLAGFLVMAVSVRGETVGNFSSSSLSKVTPSLMHRWVMIDRWGMCPKKLLL